MNVISAIQKASGILEKQQLPTPVLDAGVLLSFLLNTDRSYLYMNRDSELSSDIVEKFFTMIDKRVKGMPVQYLTGRQEFMSLVFQVNRNVLIPRPDTEILVEEVIKWAKNRKGLPDDSCSILDIGTGSGCIAVSLAHYIPFSYICAVDISEKALETAAENARLNRVSDRVSFIQGDLFPPEVILQPEAILQPESMLPLEASCPSVTKLPSAASFDIIVSNPPYIPTGDIDGLQPEVVKYEPAGALDGGLDGLDFYRRIINGAPHYLKEGGLLALEIGYHQKDEVTEIIKKQGCYTNIRCLKDYASLDRVITAIHHATGI